MAIGVVVAVCLAVTIFWTSGPQQVLIQSSITRDNITIEIVETAPAGLDNPNIRNTPDVWLELVENATQSMDIEIYTIYRYSYGPIYDFHQAIYNAAARGVRVRMLIDNEIYLSRDWDNRQRTKELMDEFDANENIEIRQLSEPMHSKVIIVDNKMAYVGSANQSTTAMDSNREVGLLIRSSVLAQALEAIFEAGWTGEENGPGFENGWNIAWVYPVATRVKVPSWVAGTEETIVGLINSAQSTIRAPIYSYSGRPLSLSYALENAASRGVSVRIMVDNWWYFEALGELDAKYPNVETKTANLGEYQTFHCKVVVVDGKWAYVGSANWSGASMTGRREIGIVFEDQELASTIYEIFRTDWESKYAYWVKVPAGFPSLLVAGIVAVAVVLVVLIVWTWRRAKKKSQKKMLRAELWASGRGEV
jgi:phosphatidylserine/phosphatidylglycerophosphate/cardiolipin synthase-like enzyme